MSSHEDNFGKPSSMYGSSFYPPIFDDEPPPFDDVDEIDNDMTSDVIVSHLPNHVNSSDFGFGSVSASKKKGDIQDTKQKGTECEQEKEIKGKYSNFDDDDDFADFGSFQDSANQGDWASSDWNSYSAGPLKDMIDTGLIRVTDQQTNLFAGFDSTSKGNIGLNEFNVDNSPDDGNNAFDNDSHVERAAQEPSGINDVKPSYDENGGKGDWVKTEQVEKDSVSDGSITLGNHKKGYEVNSLLTPMHSNFKVLPENESEPQNRIKHEVGKLKTSLHDNLHNLPSDSKDFSSDLMKTNVTIPKMKSNEEGKTIIDDKRRSSDITLSSLEETNESSYESILPVNGPKYTNPNGILEKDGVNASYDMPAVKSVSGFSSLTSFQSSSSADASCFQVDYDNSSVKPGELKEHAQCPSEVVSVPVSNKSSTVDSVNSKTAISNYVDHNTTTSDDMKSNFTLHNSVESNKSLTYIEQTSSTVNDFASFSTSDDINDTSDSWASFGKFSAHQSSDDDVKDYTAHNSLSFEAKSGNCEKTDNDVSMSFGAFKGDISSACDNETSFRIDDKKCSADLGSSSESDMQVNSKVPSSIFDNDQLPKVTELNSVENEEFRSFSNISKQPSSSTDWNAFDKAKEQSEDNKTDDNGPTCNHANSADGTFSNNKLNSNSCTSVSTFDQNSEETKIQITQYVLSTETSTSFMSAKQCIETHNTTSEDDNWDAFGKFDDKSADQSSTFGAFSTVTTEDNIKNDNDWAAFSAGSTDEKDNDWAAFGDSSNHEKHNEWEAFSAGSDKAALLSKNSIFSTVQNEKAEIVSDDWASFESSRTNSESSNTLFSSASGHGHQSKFQVSVLFANQLKISINSDLGLSCYVFCCCT